MSEPDDEEFVESALTDAIENQIRDGNPIVARQTLDQLILAGQQRADAVQIMAAVLAQEVQASVEEDRAFNMEWYIQALQALPERGEQ